MFLPVHSGLASATQLAQGTPTLDARLPTYTPFLSFRLVPSIHWPAPLYSDSFGLVGESPLPLSDHIRHFYPFLRYFDIFIVYGLRMVDERSLFPLAVPDEVGLKGKVVVGDIIEGGAQESGVKIRELENSLEKELWSRGNCLLMTRHA